MNRPQPGNNPENDELGKHHKPWLLYGSAALLVTLVALYFLWPAYREFLNEAWKVLTSGDQERIKQWVSQFGAWGPLIIIALMTVQMFLFIVPSWLLMVISVLAYGSILGGIVSVVAIGVASAIGYGAGLAIGRPALHRLLGEKKERRVRRETERYGTWAVVIARLNPLLSNDAISIIGGMLRLGFRKFLLATLAGIAPLTIAISLFGREWEEMKTGLLWLSIISLLGLGLKIWFDKHQDKKNNTRKPAS